MSQPLASPPTSAPRPPQAAPVSGWLRRLSITQKLLLAGIGFGLPLAATSLYLGGSFYDQYRLSQTQARVASSYGYLQQMQFKLRAARADLIAERVISPANMASLQENATGFQASLAPLADPELDDSAGKIVSSVAALKTSSYEAAVERVNELAYGTLDQLFLQLAERGQLSQTRSAQGRALAQLSTQTFPQELPKFGSQIAAISVMLAEIDAAGGKRTPAQTPLIEMRLGLAAEALGTVKARTSAYQASLSKPDAEYGQALDRAFKTAEKALATLRADVLEPQTVVERPDLISRLSREYLPLQYVAFGATVDAMTDVFTREQARARRSLITLLALLALITALLTLLLLTVSRAITLPLGRLTAASQKLAQGDFTVRLPVTTADELGVLSNTFNLAAEQLHHNAERDAQERLEAQRLQHNIGEFLDVTMTIADGDLTRRGKVTEDVLGNVVDSINLMTDELAGTLKQVQHASESVTGGSRQVLGTTEQIQQGAQLTAEQAQRVAEQVEQITRAIRTMAHSAQTSAETARQALLASQQGQQAVQETLGGMQNIRTEVQGVSRRVRSLGERSLEIQEIVDTISQIARRTNLLALNASVEAAGAGEAGGRFGAVADEIRQLATTSAQATTRIASLIKSVQLEVQDVIIGAEEGTREVEQGYRIAGSAGERLREIGQLTEHSAQLAESIAASTQQQVHGVEQVSSAVQQIASVAQQAEGAVQQGRNAAEQLEALAGQLNAALRRFRLPA
ncbi:twitching motility protein PilJ [Deinococcus reticulitermitis]|uniref:Twitching motility protein PilJ n=1 Tax=Deinococcus reticulitermitis TaxID=856736 RepID=A0A1H6XZD3_9DEIO|nr:methyl-accepting chemotaxis protein [Deinococcus reticulitermitis]SEJ34418.1 twitching motility protein PilJ [Deinococcus reticulitermitis]